MSIVSGPDRELRIIYSILVNGSMLLTAYFGWTLGGGWLPLQIVLALIFAVISRAVGKMFERAAYYRSQHDNIGWLRCIILGVMFAIANIVTDYGSSAAIRDANTVAAQNANALAKDTRGEVIRIEKRIAEIRAQTAWKTTYLAPSAYDALIAAAELVRDNESKRGGCGRICEAKTKELAELQAAKANAQHRLALKAEMVQLERELVEAKAKAADNKVESSAALAQVKAMVAWVGFDRNASEAKVFWGNNAIMLITCVLTTLGIIYLATELGADQPVERRPEPVHAPRYLPEPAALQTEPAPVRQAAQAARMDTYRRTTPVEEQQTDNLDRLRREMEQFLSARPELANRVSA
ncbi:MAG: hypothetical protein RLZ60_1188 [Pseudomonadota bacterium]|jgi:hypothetical protein